MVSVSVINSVYLIIIIIIIYLSYCVVYYVLRGVGLQDCARLLARSVSRGWVCVRV